MHLPRVTTFGLLLYTSLLTCSTTWSLNTTLESQQSAIGKPNFLEIQQSFKPKLATIQSIISAKPSQQSATMTILRKYLRRELARKVNVCYRRFKRCSKQLSAAFCASPTSNLSFYVWARNMAKDIMEGQGDKYENVKCSPTLVKKLMLIDAKKKRA